MENTVSTCKKCSMDYYTKDLIWGDKGGLYWVCQNCYEEELINA